MYVLLMVVIREPEQGEEPKELKELDVSVMIYIR